MKNYISSEVAQKTFFCFKVSAIFSNFCETFCSTEWFQQQQESTNEIESMAEKPKWGERKWRIIFRRRGSVAMVAKFLNDNKPKTSQKWIRTVSNFVDLIQFQFICSLILLGKFSEVESGRTVSKCRKRKREILCFFSLLQTAGVWVRKFHVVVVQRRLKNVQKKRDARAKLLFCCYKPIAFFPFLGSSNNC